jgi:hypothetical protein
MDAWVCCETSLGSVQIREQLPKLALASKLRPPSYLRLPYTPPHTHEGYSWASRKGVNAICLETWISDEVRTQYMKYFRSYVSLFRGPT